MLYNSLPFIFIFLPVALLGYLLAALLPTNLVQLSWIVVISCVFYAYWEPIYLILCRQISAFMSRRRI